MSRHALRAPDYMQHMLDAANRVALYIQGKRYDEFVADRLVQDAVLHNLPILGEASRNFLKVLPNAPDYFPAVPFADIYATRNRLIHGYFLIDFEIVWALVSEEIPELRVTLRKAIESWPSHLP